MNMNWNYPTAIRVGAGRVNEIAEVCKTYDMATPLLVTDPGIAALPMVREIVDICRRAGLGIQVFSDVKPNPSGENVAAGVAAYKAGNHDSVIALGGGSGLDAGKAVAVIAGQECSLWDLEDVGDNWMRADADRIAPVVAIPTTAGTGSEVGRASVIVNPDEHRKVIVFHPGMCPDCVILDPELTVGLSSMLTAATGMDALSHNLEAFCSPLFHPMAEGIALEGIRIIRENLPTAVADGGDIEARTRMLVASSMGATAFQRGLGAMHALSHPLGAVYDAHHGTLNAIVMPYVLIANKSAILEPIERLSRYLGLKPGFDPFLDWVMELRAEIGIPNTLREIGIDDERIGEIGEMAVVDPSAGTNPIAFDAKAYSAVAANAVHGRF